MGLETEWKKRSYTFRYALYGALFGLMFPIFSTLGDLIMQQLPLTLESLVQVQQSTPLHWVIDTAPFFLGLFASFAGKRQDRLALLNEELSQQVQERDQAIDQLQALQASLELRARYLEAMTEVAQGASLVLEDPQELLSRVVTLVSEQFSFYHTGIFLLDPTGEWAELRAASSEGGQRMLARGHRLRVGREGIVGYVTSQGQPRIVLDVGVDAVSFDNPDLPDTRSEMALPLRAGGEIIGALDVQSTEPEAFSDEDVAVLQTLADQVAVAISNARLFQQTQEGVEAMRKVYGEMGLEAWREMLRTSSGMRQRYDPQGILPAEGQWREQVKVAAREGEAVLGKEGSSATLATPIKARGGQVIGVLDAHKPAGSGEWTAQEIALLQSLIDQLGVALDSAQLYQDSQQRAEREQVIGEISASMRQTLDLDTVLQTAIREIGSALDIAEVEVRMSGSTARAGGGHRDEGEERRL